MTHSLRALHKKWVQEKGITPNDFLVLAMHVLDKDRTEFFRTEDTALTEAETQKLNHLLERRIQSEPVAYLVGQKEFFGRPFFLNKDTLIPRPDSECLIEDIKRYYQVDTSKPEYVFDIGTGSGALLITLACELNSVTTQFIGSDISLPALEVAEKNKGLHKASVTFRQGSLLQPFHNISSSSVYIVANLPYVSESIFQKTTPDVQKYEPKSALLSENEGLAHYQALFQEIPTLPLHGTCWIEISPEQADVLTNDILTIFPGQRPFIGQDLASRERFIRFTF